MMATAVARVPGETARTWASACARSILLSTNQIKAPDTRTLIRVMRNLRFTARLSYSSPALPSFQRSRSATRIWTCSRSSAASSW